MTSHSSGDSGPGLSRISWGTASFPRSWRAPATWSSARSGPGHPQAPADRDRQIGHVARVAADSVVLRRQGLEDRAHGGVRGGPQQTPRRLGERVAGGDHQRPQRGPDERHHRVLVRALAGGPRDALDRERELGRQRPSRGPAEGASGAPRYASITSRTAWVGSKPWLPGRRAGDAPTSTHTRASAIDRADRAGQRGAVSEAAVSRSRSPARSATSIGDAGRVGLAHRGDTNRGAAGWRRPRAAPALSAAPVAGRGPWPRPRGDGQLVDPQRRPRRRRACRRRPPRRRRARPRARSRRAGARRPGRPTLARPAPRGSAGSPRTRRSNQPPPPTGSRLRPSSHQTRISSGTFTTTSAATTQIASVSGLPAPAASSATKLPRERSTRAKATSPR